MWLWFSSYGLRKPLYHFRYNDMYVSRQNCKIILNCHFNCFRSPTFLFTAVAIIRTFPYVLESQVQLSFSACTRMPFLFHVFLLSQSVWHSSVGWTERDILIVSVLGWKFLFVSTLWKCFPYSVGGLRQHPISKESNYIIVCFNAIYKPNYSGL